MLNALFAVFLVLFGYDMPAPVEVLSVSDKGVVSSMHENGMLSAVLVSPETGDISISVADEEGDHQDPAPVPHLSTSWRDRNGMTHTVTTPVPSSTPSGVRAAMATHQTLVNTMQAVYPPAGP